MAAPTFVSAKAHLPGLKWSWFSFSFAAPNANHTARALPPCLSAAHATATADGAAIHDTLAGCIERIPPEHVAPSRGDGGGRSRGRRIKTSLWHGARPIQARRGWQHHHPKAGDDATASSRDRGWGACSNAWSRTYYTGSVSWRTRAS